MCFLLFPYSLGFFFFQSRCVRLWISPSAGPHDSFSTSILKGPNSPPPPCLSSSLLLFPWAQTPTTGLSQPAVVVSNSRTKKIKRRKEWSSSGISVTIWFVSVCVFVDDPLSPLVVIGGRWDVPAQVLLWVLMGGSTGWDPQGGNTPPEWGAVKRRVVKEADHFSSYELHYFHWKEKKKRWRGRNLLLHSLHLLHCPTTFPPIHTHPIWTPCSQTLMVQCG